MTRRTAFRSMAFGLGMLTRGIEARGEGFTHRLSARLEVNVEDEFAPLKTAIVHDGANAIDIDEDLLQHWDAKGWIDGHPETGPNSGEQVVKEVAGLRTLLRGFGVETLAPEAVESAYCQVFTRDPCFAVGKTLFLGVLADEHREAEVRGLARIRDRCDSVVDLDEGNLTIEGGDVMVLQRGRRVLVGTHENTTEAGFHALTRHLKNLGVEAIRVEHRMLHLDCCLAPLPDGSALYAPWKLPKSTMQTLKKHFKTLIALDKEEASKHLAANLLWLDPENVVTSTRTTRTNAKLKALGYKVHTLDYTHVKRMWGGLRCSVAPLKRG